MKREVQLYISDTRVDLFKDETISLTDTIKNVRDISKVFTTFTKSFSLPASSTNNKLFKHYYNFDIVAGFDGRTKHDARIEINQTPFKDGKIKLEGVDLKNEQPYSYRVTFFGNTVELKDIFKEDKLKDLEFVEVKDSGTTTSATTNKLIDSGGTFNNATTGVSEGDRVYNTTDGTYATITSVDSATQLTLDADIMASSEAYQILLSPFWNETAVLEKMALQSSWAKNSLIVPLITHTKRPIYDASIAENTEALVNLEYDALEDKGLVYTDLKFALRVHEVIKAIENTYTTARMYPTNITFSSDFFSSSNTDYFYLFLWLARKQGEVQTTTTASSYQFTINSFSGGTGGDSGFLGVGQSVFVSPNEVTDFEIVSTPSTAFAYTITIIRNGSDIYTTSTSSATPITINPSDLGLTTAQCAGTYQVRIGVDAEVTFTSVVFNVDGNYYDDAGILQTFSSTATSGAFTPPALATFDMKDQMPDIKVIDFVTGLFKMFNLIAFVNSSKEIEVRTLDNSDSASYYYSPTTYDITKYVDIESKKVDVALPYKEIVFKYKGLKSFLAIKHDQLFNEEWGSVNWNQDDSTTRLAGTTYKIEVPFAHFKYEKLATSIQVGWSVGDSESAICPAPLIFYPLLSSSTTDISWMGAGGTTDLDTYNIPSNSKFLSASSGEQNINFGAMINEYEAVSFSGTLFQNYYTNYISNIFNTKNRLTKIKARLPLNILLNYTLADLFKIEGSTYRINSITTDLTTGEADIELLNIT